MPDPEATSAGLSGAELHRLESLLVEFDKGWDENRLAAAARQLAPTDPLRLPALVGMVKVDLERRWQRGRKATVEGYLKAFPELGTPETVAGLLVAEYQARHQFGDKPGPDDYARRFPQRADELRRLLAEAGRSSGSSVTEANRQTVGPDRSTTPPGVPERVGRYRIVKKLGQGGMASVYLADDTQLDRQVALKVPLLRGDDQASTRQRFLREAQAAAKLRHANVCPVYDVGEADGVPYLTMAYVEGRPLSHFLRGRALPQRQAALMARKLALALQAAHARGVVHRDLKPSNVMIDQSKEPVVMDFGLAQRVDAKGSRLTQEGATLGTPAYMSPEQAAGDVKAMGPCCDVYSLGVILYEMLTGRLPFEGPVAVVFAQVLTQEPAPPSSLRPELDPRLEAVCLKAMAKKIEDRYADMGALARALDDYLRAGESVTAAPPAGPALRQPTSPAPAAEKTEPGADPFANLVSVTEERPAPVRPARGAGPREKPRLPWKAVAAGIAVLAVGVAVTLGIVFSVKTSHGTIEFEQLDPAAKVTVEVDGDDIKFGELGGKPYRLEAGEHQLRVIGADFETYTDTFTLKRGEKRVLSVRLVPRRRPAPPDDAKDVAERVPRVADPPATGPTDPPAPTPAGPPPRAASLPAGPSGSPVRWLGYVWYGCSRKGSGLIADLGDYTNLLFDKSWEGAGSERAVDAARKAGLKVVLTFNSPNRTWVRNRLEQFVRKHRDVVAAVCEEYPNYQGVKPEELSDLAGRLKREFPGLQFWVTVTGHFGGKQPDMAIPPEVDALRVNLYHCDDADALRRRADEQLPRWLARANGRPVLLGWSCFTDRARGLVPTVSAATLAACAEVARKHKLAGVVYDAYGTYQHTVGEVEGIATRPELIEGVRAAARDLGFLPGVAEAEAGFVPLFSGKDLGGWDTRRSATIRWTNENGTITGTNRSGAPNSAGVLISQQQYKDFHLRCEVLASSGDEAAMMLLFRNDNSLVRGQRRGYALNNPAPDAACTAEGWGYGSLYADDFQVPARACRLAPATEKDLGIKKGGWYLLEVIAQGESITLRVNGKQTVAFTTKDPALNRPGSFALRCHAGVTVAFRNVAVKELGRSTGEAPPKAARYPEDAVAFGGSRYKVFPEQLSWHEAKKRCEDMGGHLAVVTGEPENAFLTAQVLRAGLAEAWLGATDEKAEGRWVWVDGTPMAFLHWGPSQPNNKQQEEHYLMLWAAQNGQWADQPSRSTQHKPGFICEWPADAPPRPAAAPAPAFVPLFNGKDLSGWSADPGDPRSWRVERGELVSVGGAGNNRWLLTEKDYSDFLLRLEFQVTAGANSGVAFRAAPGEGARPRLHPEIQVQDDAFPPYGPQRNEQRTGALYGIALDRLPRLLPVGAWNKMTVEARGLSLRVTVNGAETLKTDLDKFDAQAATVPGLKRKAGRIGLQNHTGTVRFRKIDVQDPSGPGAPAPAKK